MKPKYFLIEKIYVYLMEEKKMKERTKEICIKLTPEEYDLIQKRKVMAGIQNMSAYIRKMALNGYIVNPEWPELKEVLLSHSRIGNNLNQYARKANETGSVYEEDITELKEMLSEETQVLKKTIDAVGYLYGEI